MNNCIFWYFDFLSDNVHLRKKQIRIDGLVKTQTQKARLKQQELDHGIVGLGVPSLEGGDRNHGRASPTVKLIRYGHEHSSF